MTIYWEDDEENKEKERRFEEDGKAFIVHPTDPHGFWKIRPEKKTKEELPKLLRGAFTGVAEAEKAIQAYFRSLKLPPKNETLLGA